MKSGSQMIEKSYIPSQINIEAIVNIKVIGLFECIRKLI